MVPFPSRGLRRVLGVLALLPFAFGCGERAVGPPAEPTGNEGPAPVLPCVPDQLIVQLAPGWTIPLINELAGTSTIAAITGTPFALLQIPLGQTFDVLSTLLLAAGACLTCEPNQIVLSPEAQQGSIPFYEGNLTGGDVADQQAMARVRAKQARVRAQGNGVTVAILDTGIDASHPALAARVRADGWDFVALDANADDEADGLDQDLDGSVDEGTGHGTHIAGVVHFIAPKALLLPVRVLDSEGNGTIFSVAQGVDFATHAGAKVINLSLAFDDESAITEWTLERAYAGGVFLVASAGNEGIETDTHFPASMAEVMGVAAVDAADLKASFSNYGSIVDVSAPGVGIVSTYRFHGYASWSGTSMATSFLSGTAALAIGQTPLASPAQIQSRIENGAVPMSYAGQPYEGLMGAGRLDILAVVLAGMQAPF